MTDLEQNALASKPPETGVVVEFPRPGEEKFSQREIEVIRLIVRGLTNKGIAKELDISIDTVKTHLKHILAKMQVKSRTHAAVKALRSGMVD